MTDSQTILYSVAKQVFDHRPSVRDAFWQLKPEHLDTTLVYSESFLSTMNWSSPLIHQFEIRGGQLVYSRIESSCPEPRETITLAQPDAMDQIKELVERILR